MKQIKKAPLFSLPRTVMGCMLGLFLFMSVPAWSICESQTAGQEGLDQVHDQMVSDLNDFIAQEEDFIDQILSNTATTEVLQRLDEFDQNIINWLNSWWPRLLEALKTMTKQLSVAQLEQTRTLAALVDGQLMDETARKISEEEYEAHRRYNPSEIACQMDTLGPGQNKAYRMSRALNRTFALEDEPRRGNKVGSPAASGTGAEMDVLWKEYVTNFCDKDKDLGCPGASGTMPGKHKDIPGMLWGDKQTIDGSDPNNRLMIQASMRYMIYPFSPDPVPPTAVESVNGHRAILMRRSEEARVNAIYNVVGQMIGERVGGSGLDMTTLRVNGGIAPGDASNNASYREVQETLTKDRFNNPEAIVHMIGDPVQMNRNQNAFNALRLQMMHDIYRRWEEVTFMEAAGYSYDLDKQVPDSAMESMPK